jgi:hypothetical protein
MSWADVDLSKVSVTLEPVAIGEYVFEVLGAKPKDENNDRTEVVTSIVEGPFAGRKMYLSFPAPADFDWSERIMKRFLIALGIEEQVQPGQHPAEVIQEHGRGLRFTASVKDGKVSEKYPVPRREVNIFNIKAAA